MDINIIIGGLITTLVIIFIIAPAIVGILFDYSADTYLGQVQAGLSLMAALLVVVVLCFVVAIAVGFMTGNFDIVGDLIGKVGGI